MADAVAAERAAHADLRRYRHRRGSEWFRLSSGEALDRVSRPLGQRPARYVSRWVLVLLGLLAECYVGMVLL